jgi:hypothetical protein
MSPFIIRRVLIAGVLAALSVPGAALAQPIHDVSTSATAVQRHHRPSASHSSITFTNPLGRSRGPGAGMGLL